MSKTDKPKLAKYFWNELNAETTGTAVAPVAYYGLDVQGQVHRGV